MVFFILISYSFWSVIKPEKRGGFKSRSGLFFPDFPGNKRVGDTNARNDLKCHTRCVVEKFQVALLLPPSYLGFFQPATLLS